MAKSKGADETNFDGEQANGCLLRNEPHLRDISGQRQTTYRRVKLDVTLSNPVELVFAII